MPRQDNSSRLSSGTEAPLQTVSKKDCLLRVAAAITPQPSFLHFIFSLSNRTISTISTIRAKSQECQLIYRLPIASHKRKKDCNRVKESWSSFLLRAQFQHECQVPNGARDVRRKYGVCGAGLYLKIHGRHLWIGDTQGIKCHGPTESVIPKSLSTRFGESLYLSLIHI